jgi:tetratricopeptide (TPR) repeat protein
MKPKQLSKTFLLLWLVAQITTGFAQTIDEAFGIANIAYQEKDYTTAITQYQFILQQGYQSAELHYNLGNAYYRTQQMGKAVLHYERAARLAPKDKDIQHNLSIVKAQLKDQIEALPNFFLLDWWNSLRQQWSSNAWAVSGIVLFWLAMAALIVWQIGKTRTQRKKAFFAGIALLSISMLPILLAVANTKNSEQAIVMVEETALKSSPDELSTSILLIHEGLKVKLLDKIGDWYKVRLPNGDEGWLHTEIMEII